MSLMGVASPSPSEGGYMDGYGGDVDLIRQHPYPKVFEPYSQGKSESCVLVTILYGMALVFKPTIHTINNLPSINHAYYKSRREEKDRCCKGDRCNYACGSVISLGLKIAEQGVVSRNEWPDEYPDDKRYIKQFKKDVTMGAPFLYFLKDYEVLDVNSEAIENALDKGFPVVANIRVFEDQYNFFKGVPHAGKRTGSSVYDLVYSFPKARGNPRELGHCVLITGYSRRNRSFRSRNSFGSGWGFNGDFNFPYSQIEPWQVYKAVAIREAGI